MVSILGAPVAQPRRQRPGNAGDGHRIPPGPACASPGDGPAASGSGARVIASVRRVISASSGAPRSAGSRRLAAAEEAELHQHRDARRPRRRPGG